MKTNDFDDAFKRRLENFEPDHTEEEIDYVMDYVYAHQHKKKSRKRWLILWFATLGALVSGLLVWNITQLNENRGLMETLATIEKNTPATSPKRTVQSENTRVIVHDTIYVVRDSKQKPARISPPDMHTDPKPFDNLNTSGDNKNISEGNIERTQPIDHSKTFRHKTNDPGQKLAIVDNNKNEHTSPDPGETDAITTSSFEPVKIQAATGENPKDNPSADSLTSAGSASSDQRAVTSPADKEALKDSSAPHRKKILFRAGPGAEGGNMHSGFSVNGQLFFTPRWFFGFGIKQLLYRKQVYYSESDFFNHTSLDLRNEYGNMPLASGEIKEITLKYSVTQLPVEVGYRQPFGNKGLAVVFSMGTDLDLLVKQKISFTGGFGDEVFQPSTNTIKGNFFNNLIAGFGAEATVRRVTFTLNPYVLAQLKRLAYKESDLFYGIRLRILYNFGRQK